MLGGAGRAAFNPLVAWLLTTTGGILLFLFLVRRGTRHDDDRPRDLVFARAVAAPLAGPLPPPTVVPPSEGDGSPAGAAVLEVVPPKRTRKSTAKKTPPAAEATQPKPPSDRGRAGATAAAAKGAARSANVFDKPAKKGVERAKISYRRVRISSEPDDVRSVELGRLDRGDEVEILESHEGFLRVRTPGGVTGWIKRHTIVG